MLSNSAISTNARAVPTRVAVREELRIPVGGVQLAANLTVPAQPRGLVIFAHGSGSGRHSPRNQYVADVLHERHLATLLADLLTRDEGDVDRVIGHLRFNIPLLAGRLSGIAQWAWEEAQLRSLPCGYFGASSGAAAALIAAADRHRIRAVVSRGGRPDLAAQFLSRVSAPVLLLVGGHDPEVRQLNEEALQLLNGESQLDVIPRASHLFEEPGTLEAAATLAGAWFAKHLEGE
jgi:putative phosphoribosyl transferase